MEAYSAERNWSKTAQYSFFCSDSKKSDHEFRGNVERKLGITQEVWRVCVIFTTRKLSETNR